ncbi:hypothetical protein HPB50_003083 [Hyalomma asiaticum]|uniref:Uncharacterized protein n=1 Tax=Hyalomma asiaticum TaxID=266040 RepID=A0ACB7TE31_HYAAI|nr:hypothetical protein HPB50_003083 [Hyalomma asiaticum]
MRALTRGTSTRCPDSASSSRSNISQRRHEQQFVLGAYGCDPRRKILVNKKNCCVEIYLERKIPVMLIGEGVSNVPPRLGSAAAAAPMRRQRHLAIGCNRFGGTVRKASLCGASFRKLVLWSSSIARRMILRLSQTGTHGTVCCSAPIWMYCPEVAAVSWANELMVRCEAMQTPLTSPYADEFKAALHIAFDVLHQMALMPKSAFEKLMRDIERRSEEEPSVVERALSHTVRGIDEGKVVIFSPAFYAECSQFQGEKAPQLARGTCLVRSVCVTPGRLVLRPAQVRCEAMQTPLTSTYAYAFKRALHIAFDVLHQMALMPKSAFEKLMRDIERRSEEEPLVVERALSHIVSGIDEGKVWEKCSCQQLTVESTDALTTDRNPDAGYHYRRFQEPLITGVYECNSQCRCSRRCYNRVVQNGVLARLQIFKTVKCGRGIQSLDDLSQGSFVCVYSGQLRNEQADNEDGNQYGVPYLAELDHIEVVEKQKEGYESDVVLASQDESIAYSDDSWESDDCDQQPQPPKRTDVSSEFCQTDDRTLGVLDSLDAHPGVYVREQEDIVLMPQQPRTHPILTPTKLPSETSPSTKTRKRRRAWIYFTC